MGHVEQQSPVATDGPHMHDLVAVDVLRVQPVKVSARLAGMYPEVSEAVRIRQAEQIARDLVGRKKLGIERYGQPLQAHNGRDALRDAYEEVLDLLVYLKQVTIESGDGFVLYEKALGLACELVALRRRVKGEV